MEFNATLCSTNGTEPWAANVDFVLVNNTLMTQLKTSYTHYKNIVKNGNVVIAYKELGSEILIKASATVSGHEENIATVIIKPTWARLVKSGSTNDTSDSNEIIGILTEKIS